MIQPFECARQSKPPPDSFMRRLVRRRTSRGTLSRAGFNRAGRFGDTTIIHRRSRWFQLVKKKLTSWWTRKHAPPPLPPSPVSAKNRSFFGRGACKETIFSLENEIFRRKNRPVPTLYICTAFLMEKRQQVEPGTARSKGLRPSRALLGFLTVWAPLKGELSPQGD